MSQRWTVPGSQRVLPASTRVLGDADPNAESLVTLIVRSRRSQTPPPGAMSREAFAREYGADDADLQKIEEFARTHGLSVVERSVGRRTVVLRGTVAQMSAAFGVHLKRCQTGDVTFRGREGSLSVPADLEGIVVAVLGLDDRPQAEPRVRIAAQPQTSFTPVQVASLYDFPAGVTGTGQCIAILELGGGFTQADYDTYLSSLERQVADRGDRLGRRRAQRAGSGQRCRRRGDDGCRDRRRRRSRRESRHLLRAKHRSGIRRRGDHRGTRRSA